MRKGYALLLLRRPGEARNGEALSGVSEKAWVAAVEGRRQEAIELTRQSELEGANPFVLSATWVELGDFDRAMQGLQEMYEKRSGGLVSLKMNPMFDPLRSYEPFGALLRRMNMN